MFTNVCRERREREFALYECMHVCLSMSVNGYIIETECECIVVFRYQYHVSKCVNAKSVRVQEEE